MQRCFMPLELQKEGYILCTCGRGGLDRRVLKSLVQALIACSIRECKHKGVGERWIAV